MAPDRAGFELDTEQLFSRKIRLTLAKLYLTFSGVRAILHPKKLRRMYMIDEPIHVTDAAFEKTIMQSPIPVIVDFWAPWCGPCKMVAPILDKLAKELAGKVLIAKVNTDENPEWAMKFGVQGIPTMLFVFNGKVVHRQVGALPEPMLRDVVNEFLKVTNSA
jgi:thioredoxin 1